MHSLHICFAIHANQMPMCDIARLIRICFAICAIQILIVRHFVNLVNRVQAEFYSGEDWFGMWASRACMAGWTMNGWYGGVVGGTGREHQDRHGWVVWWRGFLRMVP